MADGASTVDWDGHMNIGQHALDDASLKSAHTALENDVVRASRRDHISAAGHGHGYLPHLDGLRALALSGVLMFHFGRSGFGAGGFIGVDMFFVLSGFLVTRNILDDILQDTFSFRTFYQRRFWRLYPSSLCTSVCVLAASIYLLSGNLLKSSLRSVAASMISLSNVLFYSEAGYWDTGAELKPLLHTWSLSIEEQFYFLWPAMLTLVARAPFLINVPPARRLYAWGSIFGFCAVLAFAWAWQYESVDASGAFFLLPARVYQFALGAGLLGLSEQLQNHNGLLVDIASICSVATCVASFFYLGHDTGNGFESSSPIAQLFSGIKALPTLLGTALLILFPSSIVCRLVLCNSFMAHVGRVSYTLYLVHWPIRVFLGFVATTMPFAHGWLDHWSIMLALTAVTGMAQYILVEKRLRTREAVPYKFWLGIGFTMWSAFAVVLWVLFVGDVSSDHHAGGVHTPTQTGINSTVYDALIALERPDGSKEYIPRAFVNVTRLAYRQYPNGQLTDAFPPPRWMNDMNNDTEWDIVAKLIERASPVPLRQRLSPRDTLILLRNWGYIFLTNDMHFWWCEKSGIAADISIGGLYPCVLGDASKAPSAVIIGDSEVFALKPALSFVGKELGVSIWSVNNVACVMAFESQKDIHTPESYDPNQPLEKQACKLQTIAARKVVESLPRGTVVFLDFLSNAWVQYYRQGTIMYASEINYLRSLGLRIVFIGTLPWKRGPGRCLPNLKPPRTDCIEPTGQEFYDDYKVTRDFIENVLNLTYVDLADPFRVHPGSDENNFTWAVDGFPLLFDDRHVNIAGSLYASNVIADMYREHLLGHGAKE
ncbi:O-acetyltransferase OatA [Porphyridium purpureum]|uniref:O-acetyltransferase OatA n=1 Tax=Porphyridium purpureum TaxID=35688 RepID=A0A5J4Z4L3_PORPP|nr:O-acetyltransferase OatA [Porphyridium purpureum]|eukprot:POR2969..scf295_1